MRDKFQKSFVAAQRKQKSGWPPDNADEEVGEAEKEEDNDNNAYGAHHMYAVFSHVENTYYT